MAGNASRPGGERPDVVRDDSRMTSTYANAAEIAATPDAINLRFGVAQARQAGEGESRGQLLCTVALSPSDAKRFAIDLRSVLREHELKWGAQEPTSPFPAGGPAPASGRDRPPAPVHPPAQTPADLEKILALFRLLGELDTRVDFEQSFKLVPGHLFGNRFLLGINRRETEGRLDRRIALVCERIGMPQDLLDAFSRTLSEANHVYFGVEKDDRTLMLKAYLECRDRIEKDIGGAPATGRSFPLFTGFKWDSAAPERHAVSHYAWYPALPVAEMVERLRMTAGTRVELFDIARGIVERASEKASPEELQYLEVTEAGNPRQSFDLNIYKSGLRLEQLLSSLLKALQHFAIPASRFEPLYQNIKAEPFGHLAGGVDRGGRDFMTVYYGARQIHGSQLASAKILAADRTGTRNA